MLRDANMNLHLHKNWLFLECFQTNIPKFLLCVTLFLLSQKTTLKFKKKPNAFLTDRTEERGIRKR